MQQQHEQSDDEPIPPELLQDPHLLDLSSYGIADPIQVYGDITQTNAAGNKLAILVGERHSSKDGKFSAFRTYQHMMHAGIGQFYFEGYPNSRSIEGRVHSLDVFEHADRLYALDTSEEEGKNLDALVASYTVLADYFVEHGVDPVLPALYGSKADYMGMEDTRLMEAQVRIMQEMIEIGNRIATLEEDDSEKEQWTMFLQSLQEREASYIDQRSEAWVKNLTMLSDVWNQRMFLVHAGYAHLEKVDTGLNQAGFTTIQIIPYGMHRTSPEQQYAYYERIVNAGTNTSTV